MNQATVERVDATDYVEIFSAALTTLRPLMDKVGLKWRDHEQYDNYDSLADTMFSEFILHPLTNDYFGFDRSYRYDMPPYRSVWGALLVYSSKDQLLGNFVRLSAGHGEFNEVIYNNGLKEEPIELGKCRLFLTFDQESTT